MAKQDVDTVRAMDALRRIVQVLRASALRVEREVGISGAQLFVLSAIGAEPGQSIGEIAERTATRQSTVSEVVARLVALRLVSRTRSREDARRVVLAVTARGTDALAKSPTTPQSDLVDAFEGLPASTRRSLAAGLERWSAAAGLGDGAPAMLFEPTGTGAAGRRPARRRVRGSAGGA